MFDMRHSTVVRWLAIRIALLPVLFAASSGLAFLAIHLPVGDRGRCSRIYCIPESDCCPEGTFTPWHEWVGDALRGDFGRSLVTNESVTLVAWSAFLESLPLILIAGATAAAVGAGISALARRGHRSSAIGQGAKVFLASVPAFVALVLLILWPSDSWGYVPPTGDLSWRRDLWDSLQLYVPPSVLLGTLAATCVASARRDLSRSAPASVSLWQACC